MAETGFEVVGLKESVKLLGKADRLLRKEAGKVVRKAATQLQAEARSRLSSTPGVRRSKYPAPKGAITRRSTATSGKVGINTGRYPVMGPAEFGWKNQFVPLRKGGGYFIPQNRMRRRTFPIWRGNQNSFKFPKYGERRAALAGPGWIVQPVLRKRLGVIQEQLDRDMAIVFAESSRRAGLKRG